MRNSLSNTPPYLFQHRHGIWYARIVVPEAQQSSLGKREIRKSLAAEGQEWLSLFVMGKQASSKTNCKIEVNQ
ncbi:hypothetical protein TUM3792_41740 [Shewanella sp. MBTL60-007]|nr:hypothetical protein TUM3792_41740 [Shewanella sp. MBTL60-007]